MKLIAILLVVMLMTSCGTSTPSKYLFNGETQENEAKTSGADTSIDNHHAIPRDQYDNWSSPGNMPGGGGAGGKMSKP
jgi:hypothetical protein